MSSIKYCCGQFLSMNIRLSLATFQGRVSQMPAPMYITSKHKQRDAARKRTAHLARSGELKRSIQGILIGLNCHFQLRANEGQGGILLVLVQRVDRVAHRGDK